MKKNNNEFKDVYTLLISEWRDLSEMPEHISFRCLIKFKEFGVEGKNHLSTGYWWHRYAKFTIDDMEMANMTPEKFIPIYDY